MTGEFLAISDVMIPEVQTIIRRMIRNGLDTEEVENFLAGLDWSEPGSDRTPTGTVLLNLMNWTTMFTEGELSSDQYTSRLLQLMPTGGLVVPSLLC